MRRGRLGVLAVVGVLTVGVLGFVAWRLAHAGDEAHASNDEAQNERTFDGLSGVYAFTYRSRERASLENVENADMLTGDLALVGEMVVAPVDGEAHLHALTITSLSERSLVLGETDVIATYEREHEDEPLFADRWALVELAPDGTVRGLRFRDDDPMLFRQIVRGLVLATTQAVVGAARRWEVSEPTTHGTALSRYEVVSEDRDDRDLVLQRRRNAYGRFDVPMGARVTSRVEGAHDITIEDGVLVALEGDELIDAGEGTREVLHVEEHVALHRRGDASEGPPRLALADYQAIDPAHAPASTALTDAHFEQQIDGLTIGALVDAIALYGNGGRLPDHHRTLYRAVGLLRRDPESAQSLRPLFLDGGATAEARALILDLLAQAQTPESQTVLRTLLTTEVARTDPAFADYLQRVGFIEAPDEETVALVRSTFAEGTGDDRRSAAYVVGTMSERLATGGRVDDANALLAELHRSLDHADPDDIPHLVRGIGNARSESSVPYLRDQARADSVETRLAVADALSHVPGDDSREVATAMLDDEEREVRSAAVRALSEQAPDAGTLDVLAERLESGTLDESSYLVVLRLLDPLAGSEPARVRRCLDAMIAHGVEVPEVRTRTYALLERVAPPA